MSRLLTDVVDLAGYAEPGTAQMNSIGYFAYRSRSCEKPTHTDEP